MNVLAVDQELHQSLQREWQRQSTHLELIASENYASPAVMAAQGSILTNKYAEGYPGRRYYAGCEHVDAIENLAIERAQQLYQARYANVQPHSGSQANAVVYLALAQPGDTMLAMSLQDGGHLTHGSRVNFSGQYYQFVHYGVSPDTHLVDYDQVRDLARQHRPRIIIAGFSAYSRVLDWAAFRDIADEVGAYLLVDMAHVSGLVAAQVYPSPVPHAHVVTSTTHKTLRGPRGGMILSDHDDPKLQQRLNSALFPGVQGGPLPHVVAAKAVAFREAMTTDFQSYQQHVLDNARVMARVLTERGLPVITGGTDNHMCLLDVTPTGLSGQAAESLLESAAMVVNKNMIPFDQQSPRVTSGIRIGTAAVTTRGMTTSSVETFTHWLCDALFRSDDLAYHQQLRHQIGELCAQFPIYADGQRD